ncbi:MAG: carboxynorspermidine decarboxylase [Bacteroidaceae bacterium]|nr:carboxynorspermidine decarboxylase [Bacteroidaceae bacterium]
MIEESMLRRNLSLIREVAQESGAEIILAFKAFALWKTFPIFREYISHTTASSPYEARLALEEFGSPAHTYSPAYSEDTFDEILRCSSHITFNSFSQFSHFYPMVSRWNEEHGAGRMVSCGLRINPEHSHIETDLYNPTAPGSRFGVISADMPDILPEGLEGFHCHCHCESSAEDFVDNLVHMERRFGHLFHHLKWLNLGGGHLMTRKGYNVSLLVETILGLRRRYPNLHVILEPGSAFAWQTGPLVASVVDVVENHGIRTAILDVSFTCHMPDCLEMPYWPAVRGAETIEDPDGNVTSAQDGDGYVYRLGANSCLSGDFLSSWRFDHRLQIGERIIFEDMIHYTTVKTCMFNGIHHPALTILRQDGAHEVLREFRYEDYRDRMD